ncbi:hypothetical protein PU61_06250 [Escherichia coli]|uniref:glucosyltransferase domain-containing protein n=1 Tax=Escherichia coli TaxID=562 RepID=UPI0005441AD5|nr:glucosyltransferase domain-containing protein [Escherichia coli]KHH34572.1 hypothetical protein PU61_06250 [Escherichia coli]
MINIKIKLLILSIITSVIVYGYCLFNFSLSIDGEFFDNTIHTISLGRWGHALLHQFILPEPYTPFFSVLLSLVIIAIAAWMASIFITENTHERLVVIFGFFATPQLAYQLQFTNQADTTAIGILLVVISAITSFKAMGGDKSLLNATISIVCLCCAISIYQSFLVVAFSVYVGFFILRTRNKENNKYKTSIIKFSLYSTVIFILSLALYFMFFKIILISYGVDDKTAEYSRSQMAWGYRQNSYIINYLYNYTKNFLLGDTFFGFRTYIVGVIAVVVVFFNLVFKRNLNNATSCLMSLALVLSPLVLVFYFGNNQMPRTYISMSFVVAFSVLIIFRGLSLKKEFIIIPVFMCLYSTYAVSALFYSDDIARSRDEFISRKIVSDAQSLIKHGESSIITLYFHGHINNENRWKLRNSDTFGVSFFSWDNGNPRRICAYISYYSLAKVRCEKISSGYDANIAMKLPPYPYIGYIKNENGKLIINLGG